MKQVHFKNYHVSILYLAMIVISWMNYQSAVRLDWLSTLFDELTLLASRLPLKCDVDYIIAKGSVISVNGYIFSIVGTSALATLLMFAMVGGVMRGQLVMPVLARGAVPWGSLLFLAFFILLYFYRPVQMMMDEQLGVSTCAWFRVDPVDFERPPLSQFYIFYSSLFIVCLTVLPAYITASILRERIRSSD